MANLVPIFEREIELRKETAFPHSLWLACREVSDDAPDAEQPIVGGWPITGDLYREALIAIADASGKKEIGQEHVAKVLEIAKGKNPPTEKPSAKTWNLSEALGMYRKLSGVFYQTGYTLVLYGSAVSRHGPANDLDLMAIPWRPNANPPAWVFDQVCAQFKLSPDVGKPYLGVMRTWSKTAKDRQGRVLDFCFHRSDVTLEESCEFSMRQENPSAETMVRP